MKLQKEITRIIDGTNKTATIQIEFFETEIQPIGEGIRGLQLQPKGHIAIFLTCEDPDIKHIDQAASIEDALAIVAKLENMVLNEFYKDSGMISIANIFKSKGFS